MNDLMQALQNLNPPAQNQQRNHKVPPFTSAEPVQWHIWRRQFRIAAEINGWDEARQIREAAAAMGDMAAQFTQDIDYTQVQTIDALLGQYEAKFCPPAESSFAKMEYATAEQGENETVIQWHTRLRSLFVRAYPAADPNTSEHLKDDFIGRLRNTEVQKATLRARPADFAAALAEANNHAATEAIMAKKQLVSVPNPNNLAVQVKREINAMGKGIPNASRFEGGCFVCGGDHMKKFCQIYTKVLDQLRKEDRLKENPRRKKKKNFSQPGPTATGEGHNHQGARPKKNNKRKGVNHLGDSSASEDEGN